MPGRSVVRAAVRADVPGLMPLVRGLAAHHGDQATVTAAGLDDLLFGPFAGLTALVAEAEGQLTGYAVLVPLVRLYFGQRGMDLHHLFVTEAARGHGIGPALIRAARAQALEAGCSYMTVTALAGHRALHAFYRAQGFHDAPPAPDRFALDLRPTSAR